MFLLLVGALTANAQRFALIDMEYILKNIPAYERANEQLNQASKKWQNEVEKLAEEAKTMYKNYQSESVFLSEEQKSQKEEEIVNKEKEAAELRRQYFGPEGQKGYSVVVDRASAGSIIFASPSIDISNEVLAKLGYSN